MLYFFMQPVDATDEDEGLNADVRYSLTWSSVDLSSWCELDEMTGELKTTGAYFPDENTDVFVTISATDQAAVLSDRR